MSDTTALDDLLPARALGALDGEDLAALERALASPAGGRTDRKAPPVGGADRNAPPVGGADRNAPPVGGADRSAPPVGGADRSTPPVGGASLLAARAASWTREIEALALTTAPVAPSEIVRARLLQRIAQESPRAAAAPTAAPPVAGSAPARAPWMLRAVAAVLLVVAGWGAFDRAALRRELQRLRGNDQQLAAQLAAMHQQLVSANGEIVRLSIESRIVSAPDMHPVVLAGLATAPTSTARTFVSPRDGKALFYAYGLPAPPAGKQYQLWFIAGGRPVSGGVFDVDAAGNGALLVDHVSPVESIQAWAVTLEPTGGLPAPSGAMVLKG